MMLGAAVLRPEPGNSSTAARLEALGIDALRLPLFRVAPLDWTPPDPRNYDALLLTSANAVRHGGPQLAGLRHLPVIAVGQATADAARQAGFNIQAVGAGDVHDALALAGDQRLLHLTGRERRESGADGIAIYGTEALAITAASLTRCEGRVALLHSARAAARFAALVEPGRRGRIALAGLSPAVVAEAGGGWAWMMAPDAPSDAALIACVAERLTGRAGPRISGA